MEPFDHQDLSDHELDGMLREWKSPPAPARMRAAIFPALPWWKRSIRLPLPVAACAVLLLALALWRAAIPARPRVVIQTQLVEVPVAAPAGQGLTFHNLRPVTELRPRIIRSGHAEN